MNPAPAAPTATATLIRIRLNLRSADVRRDLAHPDRLHKTVMSLAPDNLGEHPRQQAGLLFRLEDAAGPTPPTLLVQAHQTPDLTRLPRSYGTAETRDLTAMFHALTPGRRVRYRITASPLVRRKVPGTGRAFATKDRHREQPLTGTDAIAWWQNKAAQAGLGLHSTDITPQPRSRRPTIRRPEPGSDKQPDVFRHPLTRFDGLATVTDPDLLRQALLAGIGRGKPYGAGLLSLAPA
ncbi:type I-E CRISPR-associated protein Cas6/Cse3/CasE [Streptomyces sp. NPDC005492]|uniref:type I-E CRISPR-associated protein Cas6/Cse3/CasE n=1 Tax=Streptomyces sp. NPDC005492 TaxID=3156883 RepID=UPI0033A3D425